MRQKPDIEFTLKLLDGPSVVAEGTITVRVGCFNELSKRLVSESAEEAAMRVVFALERTINAHDRLRAHIDIK